jgi:hypothetical protein
VSTYFASKVHHLLLLLLFLIFFPHRHRYDHPSSTTVSCSATEWACARGVLFAEERKGLRRDRRTGKGKKGFPMDKGVHNWADGRPAEPLPATHTRTRQKKKMHACVRDL